MFSQSWRAALEQAVPGGVQERALLRDYSWYRIGGPADLLIEPATAEQAAAAFRLLADTPLPSLVIGDGSNLLFDDAGFRGVILRIGRRMAAMRLSGHGAWAQAGIWVPRFARRVGCAGLRGIEHIVGIPGTLGGLVVMNGGSLRQGIGSHVASVRCVDGQGQLVELDQAACAFAYRRSSLQEAGLIVLETELRLEPGDPAAIRHRMIEIMAARRRKFPTRLPSCGSVFLSDPVMYDVIGPPGQAIEAVGLRGTRSGDAQIAPNHGNFIVNLGAARSADVLELIRLARQTVFERTGYWMDCEVRYVSPSGEVAPAHHEAMRREPLLPELVA